MKRHLKFLAILILLPSLFIACKNAEDLANPSSTEIKVDSSNPMSGTLDSSSALSVSGEFQGTVTNGQFTGSAVLVIKGEVVINPITGTPVTATLSGSTSDALSGTIKGSYTGVIENGTFTPYSASAYMVDGGTGSINANYTVTDPSINGSMVISVIDVPPSTVPISTTLTLNLDSNGNFSTSITLGDGSSATISGSVTGTNASQIVLTLSGSIDAGGNYSGTVSGSFSGTSTDTAAVNGTISTSSGSGSFSGTINGDGSVKPPQDPPPGTVPIVVTNVSDSGMTPGIGSPGNLPTAISDAIDTAVSSGTPTVIYWGTNYKWQPVKIFFTTFFTAPYAEYRGEYRAIVVTPKPDNKVEITYGWYDPATQNIIPLVSVGNTVVFNAGDQYIKEYSNTSLTTIKYHSAQFFWWCGIVYN